ncbi:hypothetical protein OOU_Y34scaffold00448g32 [Pyricularia oryzae Y34]|uniref:Uncharacterized protein n=2 Tax=Pyricularia oryzae TaxID=318829 RepID=A0AA97P232_PYRO3|nr:hypothetical protein OOU_Y34scaffold00448g32 [Pyricularia oryzae Y34]
MLDRRTSETTGPAPMVREVASVLLLYRLAGKAECSKPLLRPYRTWGDEWCAGLSYSFPDTLRFPFGAFFTLVLYFLTLMVICDTLNHKSKPQCLGVFGYYTATCAAKELRNVGALHQWRMSQENGIYDGDISMPHVQELSTESLAQQQSTRNSTNPISASRPEFAPLLPADVHRDHLLSSKPASREKQQETSSAPHRGPTRRILSSLWNWVWLMESLAILASIVMVISIGFVLNNYHKKPAPQFFDLNITTLVAIIATLMRAALVYVVVQVLGQVRWSWFSSPKPLYDLHHFDQGGQSLLGSCQLAVHMVRTGLRYQDGIVIMIAAVTLVVSFATTPAVQQAVKTFPCPTLDPSRIATMPIAQIQPSPIGLSVAVFNWDNPRQWSWDWPFEVGSIFTLEVLAFSDSRCSQTKGDAKRCPSNILVDDVIQGQTANTTTDLVAVSCKIYPCLRTYEARVQFGVLTETLLSTVPANLFSRPNHVQKAGSTVGLSTSYVVLRSPCISSSGRIYTNANISKYSPEPNEKYVNVSVWNGKEEDWRTSETPMKIPTSCSYHLNDEYMEQVKSFIFSSIMKVGGRCTLGELEVKTRSENVTCDSWWLASLYNSRNATNETVSRAMDAWTRAVSDQFRVIKNWPDEEWSEEILPNNITGEAMRTTVCLSLAWEWLLLPAGLIGVTMALLVVTILESHRHADSQPIWKGSALPLVMYGLGDASMQERDWVPDADRRDQDVGVETESKSVVPLRVVEETAKDIEVRFNGTRSRFEVVTDKTQV